MSKKATTSSSLIPPILLIAFNLFFIGPFTIYSGNISEFSTSFISILLFFAIPAFLFTMILYFSGIFLSEKTIQRYRSVLFGLGLLIWFQGNILVWRYGLLDGQGIDWKIGAWRGFLDGFVWLGLLVLAFIFFKKFKCYISQVSIILLIFQLLLVGLQSVQRPDAWKSNKQAHASQFPPSEIFELSSDKNVFLIILDGFQSDLFHEIITDRKEFFSELEGFTFFKENTGVFPTTKLSIPAILTGNIYRNHRPMSRYIKLTMTGSTVHSVLDKNGFDVDIVGFKLYRGRKSQYSNFYRIARPYGVSKLKINYINSLLMMDLVLFRHAPHFLKKLIYNRQGWTFQQLVDPSVLSKSQYAASRSFFDEYIQRMTVNRTNPVYKFIHLMHSHPPVVVGDRCDFSGKVYPTDRKGLKRQGKCALDQMVVFLNRLRDLGLYNSSFIIVLADHGAASSPEMQNMESFDSGQMGVSRNEFLKMAGSSLPLLIIKKPFSDGPLKVSRNLTSTADVPATICSVLQLKGNFPGRSVFDIMPDEKRQRVFMYYKWLHENWQKEYFDSIQEYILNGSVFDYISWKKKRTFVSPAKKKKK